MGQQTSCLCSKLCQSKNWGLQAAAVRWPLRRKPSLHFPQLNAGGAVKTWVDEKLWYNYILNICVSGQVCRYYTQVVWRNSVPLGCARVRCNNGWYFITCNYDPPGNWKGQRPYGDHE
ncbi:hypothetical protein MTR67_006111 [Solanum verrucosum]|uniref:SCP domain-containing protein n=1 Tax=Solanum verrucosum TaxID=315347 RepID=A0AAF0TBM2_SOLVR|nr:hypothetical protein MTR67_006111 [Solanum verrucosum]